MKTVGVVFALVFIVFLEVANAANRDDYFWGKSVDSDTFCYSKFGDNPVPKDYCRCSQPTHYQAGTSRGGDKFCYEMAPDLSEVSGPLDAVYCQLNISSRPVDFCNKLGLN